MIELIFRGKSVNSNKWIYGNIIKELSSGRVFIVNISWFNENTTIKDVAIEVIPETVGQSTGLVDKNNLEIYEGDIIEGKIPEYTGSKVIKKKGIVFFDKKLGAYRLQTTDDYNIGLSVFKLLEVIGNKFDNPEILEGGVK